MVPADSKIICDVNDENGWEEFNQLQDQGMLGGESDSDEEEDPQKEKTMEADADGDAEGDAEASKAQATKPRRRGYPILACDHSAITGESLAVDRYMGDMIFYTTGCKRGKAYAVVQTGAKTSFVGRTASMVQAAKGAGHFEQVMSKIGTYLLILVMAWILAAWIGAFFRGRPIASPGQQTLLHYTLSLLIVGVPVGLPVVTTTTMAVGAAYLAKKKAIVQKLTAIESLAVSCDFSPFFRANAKKCKGCRYSVLR